MVSFNGETATTEADRRGDWSIRLKPMKADGKSHALVVQGDNKITLNDVVLTKTYGVGKKVVFGPMYQSHRIEDDKVLVRFQYSGSGLATLNRQPPNWFEISDGSKYFKADSKIVGNETVVVTSSEVKKPVAVRFGWHPLARFNLINRERLPAVPFRTRRPKP